MKLTLTKDNGEVLAIYPVHVDVFENEYDDDNIYLFTGRSDYKHLGIALADLGRDIFALHKQGVK